MIQQVRYHDSLAALNFSKHIERRMTANSPDIKSSILSRDCKNQSRSQISWHQCSHISPTNQYEVQFKMKQKFQQLYRRIQKISRCINSQQLKIHMEKNLILGLQKKNSFKKLKLNKKNALRQQLIKLRFKSRQPTLKLRQQKLFSNQNNSAQLTTSSQLKSRQTLPNIKMLNYAKIKPPMKLDRNLDLKNHVEDFLSVEKIKLNNIEKLVIEKQQNQKKKNFVKLTHSISFHHQHHPQIPLCLIQSTNHQFNSLLNSEQKINGKKTLTTIKLPKKFIPPFETYQYRDLIWRVAYSNQYNLTFPQTYNYKIRVYVGIGNNSKLVKNIIFRRPWYQITDKIQQANFIWTQLKVQSVFASQTKLNKNNIKIHNQPNNPIYLSKSIWTKLQQTQFQKYFCISKNAQSRMSQSMKFRNKNILKAWKIDNQQPTLPQKQNDYNQIKLHNHMINSYIVGNKKALFQTMTDYYTSRGDNVFKYLPLTFHICNGLQDENYLKFLNYYYAFSKKQIKSNPNFKYNAWIVKPGQNTNRGQGITVCLTLHQIKKIITQKNRNQQGKVRTYIVQKYIQKPLLYKKRKFDLRHYIMINCSNGLMKGYWFNEGYVRTTSSQYTLKQSFGCVHLTNDAVQKQLPDYGKYQKGNKISYDELNEYLLKNHYKLSFWKDAFMKMKAVATDVIRACAPHLDPDKRTNFQIFGLDFMLDQNLQVWLIQVNTNPCLELSCPLLAKIIPKMIQNTLQICLDPLFPAPVNFVPKTNIFKKDCFEEMGYELIYDQRFQLINQSTILQINDQTLKRQVDDCFQDDGEDWNQD